MRLWTLPLAIQPSKLSEFFWLVDRDPYVMAYEIIPENMKNNWVVLYIIPKKKPTNQGVFIAQMDRIVSASESSSKWWFGVTLPSAKGNGKAILAILIAYISCRKSLAVFPRSLGISKRAPAATRMGRVSSFPVKALKMAGVAP